MGRAVVFMLILAGLMASGFKFFHQTHPSAKTVMEHGVGASAAAELKDAGDQLYLTYKFAGTYDGPDLKNFADLQLYRADDTGFCIQVVKEAQVFRLIGPGGMPEPGHC
jgi:hypothetical protein